MSPQSGGIGPILVTLPLTLPRSSSGITEKVTGGAHFTSDAGTNIGDLVYLSLVGMEKSGEWSGQGSYRDPAIGLEAHFTFDTGWPLFNT